MTLLLWLISLLIDLFVLLAHLNLGLTNAISDLIASIPNIFFATGYFLLLSIINMITLSHKRLFQIKNLVLSILYLGIYLFFNANTTYLQNTSQILITSSSFKNNITVCSQNTKHAQALNQEEFWQTIKLYKCDIILLQEVSNSENFVQTISQNLKQYMKQNYTILNYGEFIVASSIPIKLLSTSTENGFLATQIQYNNKTINLINIHIWTPLQAQTPQYNPSIAYEIPPYIVRYKQTQELLAYLLLIQNQPTILIGDFNMLPTHPFLSKQLKTVFFKRIKEKHIITPTFSNKIPIIEIDHTFTNYPSLVKNRYTLLNQFSDHALQIINVQL